MSCKKYTITNNTNKIVVYSYQECSELIFVPESEIKPGQTKNIWAREGTFKSSLFSQLTVESTIFPLTPVETRTPTPTPSLTFGSTPTSTPTNTSTPNSTSTPTVTLTPSGTTTPTPSVTLTSTPELTSTPQVTSSPGSSPTPEATATPEPTLTPSGTTTPEPTVTVTPTSSDIPVTPSPTETPIPVTGYGYNLVVLPYNLPTSGNTIMTEQEIGSSGTTDPNVFISNGNGIYFNSIDTTNTNRTDYFSGFTGQSVTITLTQNGDSAIYSGDTNAFRSWSFTGGTGFSFG